MRDYSALKATQSTTSIYSDFCILVMRLFVNATRIGAPSSKDFFDWNFLINSFASFIFFEFIKKMNLKSVWENNK